MLLYSDELASAKEEIQGLLKKAAEQLKDLKNTHQEIFGHELRSQFNQIKFIASFFGVQPLTDLSHWATRYLDYSLQDHHLREVPDEILQRLIKRCSELIENLDFPKSYGEFIKPNGVVIRPVFKKPVHILDIQKELAAHYSLSLAQKTMYRLPVVVGEGNPYSLRVPSRFFKTERQDIFLSLLYCDLFSLKGGWRDWLSFFSKATDQGMILFQGALEMPFDRIHRQSDVLPYYFLLQTLEDPKKFIENRDLSARIIRILKGPGIVLEKDEDSQILETPIDLDSSSNQKLKESQANTKASEENKEKNEEVEDLESLEPHVEDDLTEDEGLINDQEIDAPLKDSEGTEIKKKEDGSLLNSAQDIKDNQETVLEELHSEEGDYVEDIQEIPAIENLPDEPLPQNDDEEPLNEIPFTIADLTAGSPLPQKAPSQEQLEIIVRPPKEDEEDVSEEDDGLEDEAGEKILNLTADEPQSESEDQENWEEYQETQEETTTGKSGSNYPEISSSKANYQPKIWVGSILFLIFNLLLASALLYGFWLFPSRSLPGPMATGLNDMATLIEEYTILAGEDWRPENLSIILDRRVGLLEVSRGRFFSWELRSPEGESYIGRRLPPNQQNEGTERRFFEDLMPNWESESYFSLEYSLSRPDEHKLILFSPSVGLKDILIEFWIPGVIWLGFTVIFIILRHLLVKSTRKER